MAKRHDLLGVATADTVIGSGVKLKGNLTSDGDIVLDGSLQGNVKALGNVAVGVNARIVGDISGQNISIAGHLQGNIKATEQTSISESGEVNGDISTRLLEIVSGAILSGSITMPKPAGTENNSEQHLADTPKRKL